MYHLTRASLIGSAFPRDTDIVDSSTLLCIVFITDILV